jgi:hypothetical protein
MESKMDKFLVKPNSWHYKLVEEHITDKYPYDLREKAMPKDFCSYWRRVMIESLKFVGMIGVGVAALGVVLGGIGFMIYSIFFDFSGAGFPFLVFFLFVGTVFAILEAPDMLRERKINKLKANEPTQTTNIFVQRYKAWKGKFCPAIQYEKES